ncbi:hypothetical protein Hanom_Chr13g01225661 [Helianthus anomalus]
MMSSPVVSRPEAVILEEDGSVQHGNMGGDGSPSRVVGGGSHAEADHMHEVREKLNDDFPPILGNRNSLEEHVQGKPQSGCEGGQWINSPRNFHVDGDLLFRPPVESHRPTKKSFKIRPRNSTRARNKSPNSNQRPKKRIRDDEDFIFDLNIKASEENKDASGDSSSSADNPNSDKVSSGSDATPEGIPSLTRKILKFKYVTRLRPLFS